MRQLRLASFKGVHFRLHGGLVHPIYDGRDDAPDLLLDPDEFVTTRCEVRTVLHAQAVHRGSGDADSMALAIASPLVAAERADEALAWLDHVPERGFRNGVLTADDLRIAAPDKLGRKEEAQVLCYGMFERRLSGDHLRLLITMTLYRSQQAG